MQTMPNILWLMTDEQRCDSLGFYGSSWAQTPGLDRLAADATVFASAYTPSPVCMPARLAMLTGRLPDQTRVWLNEGNPMVEEGSLLDLFHDAGYRSATFGKQHYGARTSFFQTEQSLVIPESVSCYDYLPPYRREDYGGIKLDDKWLLGGTFPEPIERKREWQVVDAAIGWLDEHRFRSADEPFLLRLSFSAPHTPVVPPAPYDTMIPEDSIDLPEEADTLFSNAPSWLARRVEEIGAHRLGGRDVIQAMRRFYYGEVAFVDSCFSRLIAWMETRGLLDNTIVCFVSDHGTHLGDVDLVQKQTFAETVARVPYFIRPVGGGQGRVVETPVSTLTLLPTLLGLAGISVPVRVGDCDLSGTIAGGEPEERPVFSEIGYEYDRLVMVRYGEFKLIVDADDPDEIPVLFNVIRDPLERVNLAMDPEYLDTVNRLRSMVESRLKDTPRIEAMVRLVSHLDRSGDGSVECVTCKSAERVARWGDPVRTAGYAEAYVCGHCGQRFAIAGSP